MRVLRHLEIFDKRFTVNTSLERSCLQCEVDIGVYTVYVFSSGAQLLSDSSVNGELTIVKESGDEARLTKACK